MVSNVLQQPENPKISLFAGASAALIVGQFTTNLVPFLLLVSIRQAGLDETSASFLLSAEFAGFLLAALVVGAAKWASPRVMATLACLSYAVASLASGWADNMWLLMVARTICGLAGGAAMASTTRAMSSHKKYAPLIAVALVSGTLFGATALTVIPILLESSGPKGVYGFLAIVAVVCAPFCFGLSTGARVGADVSQAKAALTKVGITLIAAYACIRLSDSTLWPFAERFGAQAGLDEETTGLVLGAVTLLALTAPFFAMRAKLPRPQFIFFACAAGAKALSVILILTLAFPIGYALGQAAAIFTLILVMQLAMSGFAYIDATGRLAVLGGIVAMVCDAVGPLVSGIVFKFESFVGIASLSSAFSFVAMVIMVFLVFRMRKLPSL
jgi:MFS family permease